jgi:hypothetical protein
MEFEIWVLRIKNAALGATKPKTLIKPFPPEPEDSNTFPFAAMCEQYEEEIGGAVAPTTDWA